MSPVRPFVHLSTEKHCVQTLFSPIFVKFLIFRMVERGKMSISQFAIHFFGIRVVKHKAKLFMNLAVDLCREKNICKTY